jgi:hypothetical protein
MDGGIATRMTCGRRRVEAVGEPEGEGAADEVALAGAL